MKRTKQIQKKQADAILVGDMHLRETCPACRDERFFEEQYTVLHFIEELRKEHDCEILCAGDLLHFWKPSPYLLSKIIEYLPAKFKTIYGNHDLPQHNIENAELSGVHTLEKAGILEIIDSGHWECEPKTFEYKGRTVLIQHVMTYKNNRPFPGIKEPPARGLLKKYANVDLILTGHNHQCFTEKADGQILVNPGCITRQTMGEASYTPTVFLWYADTNTIEAVELPTFGECVKPEESAEKEARENRIDAFISSLDGEWVMDIDFEKNISNFLVANEVETEVKEIINQSMEK